MEKWSLRFVSRQSTWKLIGHAIAVIVLTAVSQVGGMIWLLALWIDSFFPGSSFSKWRFPVSFLTLYTLFSFCIIPVLAPFGGRVALPVKDKSFEAKSIVYCFLNRHYVKAEIRTILLKSAMHLQADYPGTKLYYLDANFPFGNGFPLFPHLSHNDGK